jgi:hypothetical protein
MKIVSTARALSFACALSAVAGTVACSSADLTSSAVKPVTLSFSASAKAAAASAESGTLAFPPTLGTVPTITKIQLVITKLALSRSDEANCLADDAASRSSECQVIASEPLLIDMPVDGGLHTQVPIPSAVGLYSKLEAKLAAAGSGTSAGAAFLEAYPDLDGYSLRVEGSFNGVPFTYRMAVKADIDMKFSPAFVVNAGAKNATIGVDVSRWFISMHGYVIDPSKATPGTPSATIIENNIRASFRAFEDNQRLGLN